MLLESQKKRGLGGARRGKEVHLRVEERVKGEVGNGAGETGDMGSFDKESRAVPLELLRRVWLSLI